MTVLNDLDPFHLVMDTIDRVAAIGDKGIYLKKQLMDRLIERDRRNVPDRTLEPASSQM